MKNAVAEGFDPSGHKSAADYFVGVGSDTLGDLGARPAGPMIGRILGPYGKMAHNANMKALSQWFFTKDFVTFPALSELSRSLSAQSFDPSNQSSAPDQTQD